MEQFIWKSGRPQASRKSNDDLIMASAIGCWVRETVFDEIGRGEEYREVMLSCMVRNPTSLNTSIPGMIGHRPVEDKSLMDSYREFSWLLKG